MDINTRGSVPADVPIPVAGDPARAIQPTTPGPTLRTETIQHNLPPKSPRPSIPPDTTLPSTNSTFPNPTPQRPTDICHPSGRALPGAAAFSREAGSC